MELTDSDQKFVQILSIATDNGKLSRTPEGGVESVDKGEASRKLKLSC